MLIEELDRNVEDFGPRPFKVRFFKNPIRPYGGIMRLVDDAFFFFGNWQPFHLGMYYCIKKHCKLWGIVWRLMRFNDSARLKYQYRSKVVIIFSRWYRWWFHVFYFQLGKWSWPIFVQMGWFNHHLVMVCVFSSSECHCGFSKVSKGDETFKHINNHGSHCQLWWLIQPS